MSLSPSVIIADDHELLRQGFVSFIESYTIFKVIAEAKNGEELVDLCREKNPDLVITDIMMPKVNGIEAIRHIVKHNAEVPILVYSMLDNDLSVIQCMQAGARGYISKNACKEDFIHALDSVCYQQKCNEYT